ncbi:transposase [Methylophilus sp. Leaf408]|uniref:transposase n=1 Tax=Methylophilus sp. Leaf408 TaxID=2876561 RepID=UPI00351D3FB1
MARLPRVAPVGVPQHIIQRGNNRHTCFVSEEDFIAYLGWLKEYSQKYEVEVHAWVLMSNHVHLLFIPKVENGISQMMQAIGRQYVRYFNFTYKRTGTLWEGRYKSCLVDAERHLLELSRYMELNPVRANMVGDPASYVWSSYQINALGKVSSLCSRMIYM